MLRVNEKIIDKSGAFFSFKEEKLGQGRENVKIFLRENTAVADEIEKLIRQKHFGPKDTPEKTEQKEKMVKAGKK